MNGDNNRLFRDLPDPPRSSHENYVSALVRVEQALNQARRVAPDKDRTDWINDRADTISGELDKEIRELNDQED